MFYKGNSSLQENFSWQVYVYVCVHVCGIHTDILTVYYVNNRFIMLVC